MKTLPLIAAAGALLALSACKNEPEVVDSRAPDPLAEQVKNAPPVELPPPVTASVSFRCQPGNSIIYVDFFKGDKLAVLRTVKDGPPTALKAPNAGEPYVADGGYKLAGTHKAVTVQLAGAAAKTCKA